MGYGKTKYIPGYIGLFRKRVRIHILWQAAAQASNKLLSICHVLVLVDTLMLPLGVEKALLQAVLRARFCRGQEFIPKTAVLSRNKSTSKGVMKLWHFSEWNATRAIPLCPAGKLLWAYERLHQRQAQ